MSTRLWAAKVTFAVVLGFLVSGFVTLLSDEANAHVPYERRPMSVYRPLTPTHWYHSNWHPLWGSELRLYVSAHGVDTARGAYLHGAAAGAMAMCSRVPTWWGTGACTAVVGTNHSRITGALARANRQNRCLQLGFSNPAWPSISVVRCRRG